MLMTRLAVAMLMLVLGYLRRVAKLVKDMAMVVSYDADEGVPTRP